MPMPSEAELEQALSTAKQMREQDMDENFVAKTLLSHQYRLHKLLHVMEVTKHYLRSGHGSREHTDLLKAIEEAEQAEYRPGEDRRNDSSLMI